MEPCHGQAGRRALLARRPAATLLHVALRTCVGFLLKIVEFATALLPVSAMAIVRPHRYRFLSTGTIEEKMFQRQLSKEGLLNVIEDKPQLNSFAGSDLRRLFSYNPNAVSDTHEQLCCRCAADCAARPAFDDDHNSLGPKRKAACCEYLAAVTAPHQSAEAAETPMAKVSADMAAGFAALSSRLDSLSAARATIPEVQRRVKKLFGACRATCVAREDKPATAALDALKADVDASWIALVPKLHAIIEAEQPPAVAADDNRNVIGPKRKAACIEYLAAATAPPQSVEAAETPMVKVSADMAVRFAALSSRLDSPSAARATIPELQRKVKKIFGACRATCVAREDEPAAAALDALKADMDASWVALVPKLHAIIETEQSPAAAAGAPITPAAVGHFKPQCGLPADDDLKNWSHHSSVATIDDEVLCAALSGRYARLVSFVFGLEISADIIRADTEGK